MQKNKNTILSRRSGITNRKKKKKASGFKLKNQKAAYYGTLAIILLVAGFFLYFPVSSAIERFLDPPDVGAIKVNWYKDYNNIHLRYARSNGITPFKSEKAFREGIREMVRDDKLEKVTDSRYYVLKGLTHSHPYLTPEAVELLDDIGKTFREKLDENGKGKYYFQISSLLRTQESQRKLRGSNRNATNNTSHLYGTTFDIAYRSLVKKPLPWVRTEVTDGPAIKLLSEAIGELRKQGRCVVVTEKYEKCFHITVVR